MRCSAAIAGKMPTTSSSVLNKKDWMSKIDRDTNTVHNNTSEYIVSYRHKNMIEMQDKKIYKYNMTTNDIFFYLCIYYVREGKLNLHTLTSDFYFQLVYHWDKINTRLNGQGPLSLSLSLYVSVCVSVCMSVTCYTVYPPQSITFFYFTISAQISCHTSFICRKSPAFGAELDHRGNREC